MRFAVRRARASALRCARPCSAQRHGAAFPGCTASGAPQSRHRASARAGVLFARARLAESRATVRLRIARCLGHRFGVGPRPVAVTSMSQSAHVTVRCGGGVLALVARGCVVRLVLRLRRSAGAQSAQCFAKVPRPSIRVACEHCAHVPVRSVAGGVSPAAASTRAGVARTIVTPLRAAFLIRRRRARRHSSQRSGLRPPFGRSGLASAAPHPQRSTGGVAGVAARRRASRLAWRRTARFRVARHGGHRSGQRPRACCPRTMRAPHPQRRPSCCCPVVACTAPSPLFVSLSIASPSACSARLCVRRARAGIPRVRLRRRWRMSDRRLGRVSSGTPVPARQGFRGGVVPRGWGAAHGA